MGVVRRDWRGGKFMRARRVCECSDKELGEEGSMRELGKGCGNGEGGALRGLSFRGWESL